MRFIYMIGVIVTIFWGILGQLGAAEHYIRPGSSGDCSTWEQACSELPSTLVRGDTYFLAAGTYPGYTYDDAENAQQIITIKKATEAEHGTDSGWNNTYAQGVAEFGPLVFVTSYYSIDGSEGGGPYQWRTGHGIRIVATSGGSKVVSIKGPTWYEPPVPHHLVFEHVEFMHRGVGYTTNDDGIYSTCLGSCDKNTGSHDVVFRYCYFHDFSRNALLTGYTKNWLFEYNYVERNSCVAPLHTEGWQDFYSNYMTIRYNVFSDHAGTAFIALKTNSAQPHEYWYIYGNTFFKHTSYDGTVGGEGIVGSTVTGYVTNTVSFHDNYPDADTIVDGLSQFLTASRFMAEGQSMILVRGSQNNDGLYTVVDKTDSVLTLAADNTVTHESAGADVRLGSGYTRALHVYNNNFINTQGLNVGLMVYLGIDNHAVNNIWYNNTGNIINFAGFDEHDYNWFYNNWRESPVTNLDLAPVNAEEHAQQGTADPFMAWSLVDNSESTDIPFTDWETVSLNLHVPTESGLILMAPFDRDAFGNIRGADGVWDRGAYEYVSFTDDGGPVETDGGPIGNDDGLIDVDGEPIDTNDGPIDVDGEPIDTDDELVGDQSGDAVVNNVTNAGCSCHSTQSHSGFLWFLLVSVFFCKKWENLLKRSLQDE